jgi:hypothetical protein
MRKTTGDAGKGKIVRALRLLVDQFMKDAQQEHPKMTVQDFLRVITALKERDEEAIEEIRVRWVSRNDADAQ